MEKIIVIILMVIMFILAFAFIIWQGIHCYSYLYKPITETPAMCVMR
jgi:hypothetical protein